MSKRLINNGPDRTTWVFITAIAAVTLVIITAIMKFGPSSSGTPAVSNEDSAAALVDKPLPDVVLNDLDGKPVKLSDLRGKNVVLFFNEGLMCYPACWNQVASLGNDQRFNSEAVAAFSVVIDNSRDWQKAIEKMPSLAPANVLFDTGAKVSRQLGMLTVDSSMHRNSNPGHTYLVVDKQGVVRYFYDDPSMSINNDLIWQKIQSL